MKRNQLLILGSVLLLAIIIVGGIILRQSLQPSTSSNLKDQTDEIMIKDAKEVMEKDSDLMEKEEGTMEKDQDKMEKEDTTMDTSGLYIPYNNNSLTSNSNVIFFAASWCPTCRGLDNAINSELDKIPSNLTILKADYDAETLLKQKYGVTYQHTLVQVDKDGNMLKKWNGGDDISSIVSQLI